MAKTYILADDFDGTQDNTVATITWAFDGQGYEIDLTDKNADRFLKAVEPFMTKSREISRLVVSARAGESESAQIRAWAVANQNNYKWEVGEKGRISQEIKDDYHQAMKEAEANK